MVDKDGKVGQENLEVSMFGVGHQVHTSQGESEKPVYKDPSREACKPAA